MLQFQILLPAILNGLATGAVYALVALGLTLIYGVLHIVNFAHGSLLMLALYGVYFLYTLVGIDPYLALPIMVPAMFLLGYALQRTVIATASHGREENILLVTLGLSIIIDNLALYLWSADTRTINPSYAFETVDFGIAFIAEWAQIVEGIGQSAARKIEIGGHLAELCNGRKGIVRRAQRTKPPSFSVSIDGGVDGSDQAIGKPVSEPVADTGPQVRAIVRGDEWRWDLRFPI